MVYFRKSRVILLQVSTFFAQIKGAIKSNYQRLFWAYFVEISVFRGIYSPGGQIRRDVHCREGVFVETGAVLRVFGIQIPPFPYYPG